MSSGGMMSSPFTLFREQDVRDRDSSSLVEALGNMLLDATYSFELLKRDVERISRDVGDLSFEPPPPFDPSILADVASSGLHSDLDLDDGTNPHGTTAGDLGLATVATTGSYTNLINVPSTFTPSAHAFLGNAHSGLDLGTMSTGDGLVYDGTNMVNAAIITRDTDGFWTIGKTTDEFLELLNGSDLIFQNVSGSTVSAASPGSAVAWAYSATRYVTIGWWDSKLRLTDGTDIPDGDDPIIYTPNATNGNRALELKVKTTWKGASADLVIDGTLLNAAGKAMAIREIDVCVDGEAKKMLVLASEPYDG